MVGLAQHLRISLGGALIGLLTVLLLEEAEKVEEDYAARAIFSFGGESESYPENH